ncbi:MAG: NUDIX domain-containing protein [Planctomycetota bacterium]|jgi:8-oxo-dGTP pyrophosphatase MutT (NUDIX family)
MPKKKDTQDVAKAWIRVDRDGVPSVLMSVKYAPGKSKDGKLEFLGGHLEEGDSPFEGMVRELIEEETTKRLAELVTDQRPTHVTKEAGRATHHLFEFDVNEAEVPKLQHSPNESRGFVLVPADKLDTGALDEKLTKRTKQILKAFRRT